jgi:hypothetical protein
MIIFLPLFDHLALAEYGFIAFKSFTQSTCINNDSDGNNIDSNVKLILLPKQQQQEQEQQQEQQQQQQLHQVHQQPVQKSFQSAYTYYSS